MILKLKQKNWMTEYIEVGSTATIKTVEDGPLDDGVAAIVKFKNESYTVRKEMNAWLLTDAGILLQVLNRDFMWS